VLLALKTITFVYDRREDRILAAVNAGSPESWSCWLTRRMALALLAKADEFVSKTSKLLPNATAGTREQLLSFEREAALAETAGSLTRTPQKLLAGKSRAAELLGEVRLNQRGATYQIDLQGDAGGGAVATIKRAELQRIMQMLDDVTIKAGWGEAKERAAPDPSLPIVRH